MSSLKHGHKENRCFHEGLFVYSLKVAYKVFCERCKQKVHILFGKSIKMGSEIINHVLNVEKIIPNSLSNYWQVSILSKKFTTVHDYIHKLTVL